jgi:hypothetical protein
LGSKGSPAGPEKSVVPNRAKRRSFSEKRNHASPAPAGTALRLSRLLGRARHRADKHMPWWPCSSLRC